MNALSVESSSGRWITLKILIAENPEATGPAFPPVIPKQSPPHANTRDLPADARPPQNTLIGWPFEPGLRTKSKIEFNIPRDERIILILLSYFV